MREIHVGRLIDHVHLRASDLAAAKRFYRAVLGALGKSRWANRSVRMTRVIYSATSYGSTRWAKIVGPLRTCTWHFKLPTRRRCGQETVRRFHEAGLAAGGRDNGKPGERKYHPGYFAAFLLDPDGNNVEAVYHGPGQRSADS